MSTIITRQSAITLKLPKYFTGEVCKNGHVAERYTQSGTCVQCLNHSRPTTERNPNNEIRIKLQQAEAERKERVLKLREAEAAYKLSEAARKAEHAAQALELRKSEAARKAEHAAQVLELRKAEKERKAQAHAEREARNAGKPKGDLVKFTATVQHRNANRYRDFAFAVTQLRDPTIDRARVTLPNLKAPTWSGLSTIGRYTVAAYPEDQGTIFNYALELMKESYVTSEQIAADRAKRDAEILAETNAEIDAEWPEESNA